MEYTAAEIKRRFKEMKETDEKKIQILAELNGCKEKVIRDVLAGTIGDKELAEIKPTPIRLPPEATRIRAKVTKTEPEKKTKSVPKAPEEKLAAAEPEEAKTIEEKSYSYALGVLYDELNRLDRIIKIKETDLKILQKQYQDIVNFIGGRARA